MDFVVRAECLTSVAGVTAYMETFTRVIKGAVLGQPLLWEFPKDVPHSDGVTVHVFVPASKSRSGRH
jgi:hypothetical protein